MTAPATDRAVDAVTQLVNTIHVSERLVGQIKYQVTANHITPEQAWHEIRRLLGIPVSGASAASPGGSPPDGGGSVQAQPSPARHAATSPPTDHVPGTYDFPCCDAKRRGLDLLNGARGRLLDDAVRPISPAAGWVPNPGYHDLADVVPMVDPALTETSPGLTATPDGLPGPANPTTGGGAR